MIVYIRCFVIILGLPEIIDVISIKYINRKLDYDIFQLRYATCWYCFIDEFCKMIISISYHTIRCALVIGYFWNVWLKWQITHTPHKGVRVASVSDKTLHLAKSRHTLRLYAKIVISLVINLQASRGNAYHNDSRAIEILTTNRRLDIRP